MRDARANRPTASTGRKLIVGEQLLVAARNILLLVLLGRIASPEQSAALIVAFTTAQMVASLGFAGIGEPTLLAPRRWVAERAYKSILVAAISTAAAAALLSAAVALFAGLDGQLVMPLAVLAAVMTWNDIERSLHFVIGKPIVPFSRNIGVIVLVVLMVASDLPPYAALGIIAIVWSVSSLATVCRRPVGEGSSEPEEWSPGRSSVSGLVNVGVSYAVIQGTLFMTMWAFGPLWAVPLRLAQSLMGPVQMLATGLRNALTVRGQAPDGTRHVRPLVWLISPAVAFIVVLGAHLVPEQLGVLVVGPDWNEVVGLLPALALQASIVSIGTVGSARLRRLGLYWYAAALRAISGFLSLVGIAAIAVFVGGQSPAVVLLGLSLGPVITAPFWMFSKREDISV